MILPLLFSLFLSSHQAQAACTIYNSDGSNATLKADALARVLSSNTTCPTSAPALKALLSQRGLRTEPSMVANRGFHNPELGSFSFFERVSGQGLERGDFFFGHFTAKSADRTLQLDQAPAAGKLLIELIVWDSAKGYYNFYELIGSGGSARWFYRGDTADILSDNALLYRTSGTPQFGSKLRCSACHTSGGPIMKELAFPHNDWWTRAKGLPLGSAQPSGEVKTWLASLVDASEFAQSVSAGIHRLENSGSYQALKANTSLQEQLRPLFCETEINIESDLGNGSAVAIPSAFFLSPLLGSMSIGMPWSSYGSLLNAHRMNFPETMRQDADHAWLTPVKGFSDLLAIQSLISRGLVDSEFVTDVLAVDMTTPVFSSTRCGLLKLVPLNSTNWRARFLANLAASDFPGASELHAHLSVSNQSAHLEKAARYAQSQFSAEQTFARLLWVRAAVSASEISQNPRGQILEPGFRVIFPQPH